MNNVIKNTLEFVQSLQNAKKAHQNWSDLELIQRFEIIQKWVQINKLLLGNEEKWLSKYLDWQFKQSQNNRTNDQVATPTGIIFVLIDLEPVQRYMWERIIPALLAGNAIYLQVNLASFKTVFDFSALPDGVLHWCQLSDDDLQMTLGHPSVQAISYVGVQWSERLVIESAKNYKRLQILGAGKNTALVFPDADLEKAAEGIIKAVSSFDGLSNLNIQKVIVTETQSKELLAIIESKLAKGLPETFSYKDVEINQKIREQVSQVMEDAMVKRVSSPVQAKIEILHNLNNCSPWQQDPFSGPVLVINEVKYVHEMVKWANTSYLGLLAQIWGGHEKYIKFGAKLEVGQVLHNAWYESQIQAIQGCKQSAYGNMDFAWNGSFYSNVKILAN